MPRKANSIAVQWFESNDVGKIHRVNRKAIVPIERYSDELLHRLKEHRRALVSEEVNLSAVAQHRAVRGGTAGTAMAVPLFEQLAVFY